MGGDKSSKTIEERCREMQEKPLDELMVWAAELDGNPLTQKLVQFEFQRRVAEAQIESAKATKSAAERAMLSIVVGVAISVTSWFIKGC